MRRVCVVSSNRSDYSKLKSVIKAIRKHRDLKLILIVTGSHLLPDFGQTINTIRKDGFKIDAVARIVVEGEDLAAMAKSVGLASLELPTLFELCKPDIVVICGDRFETLGIVIPAVLMNIPLAHIQGGEVTGSIDESIRHAITKLSHIHFPATIQSTQRIIKMGERTETVFCVGCPSMDIISSISMGSKGGICRKYNMNPDSPFLLLIQHPVTTEFDQAGAQIKKTLEVIHALRMQTIMLYPNIDAGSERMIRVIRKFELIGSFNFVHKYKHIVFEDFIRLIKYCGCIIGNSSSGIREACFFGTPAVNIGTRQEGRERGRNVIDVGYKKEKIKEAILKSLEVGRYRSESIYGSGQAGKKIADILAAFDFSQLQKHITY